MNYQVILSGVRCTQSFLEVKYLSPQEALGVANLALDVLIVYKLEASPIPNHIRKTLLDFVAFFLSGHTDYYDIRNAILQEHSQPMAASAVLKSDITENDINLMFKCAILFGIDHDLPLKNKLFDTLMFSLNKCNYELSLLRLYCIENEFNSGFKKLSEYEKKALSQAKKYMCVLTKSLDKPKWVWWLKASGLLKEEYHETTFR